MTQNNVPSSRGFSNCTPVPMFLDSNTLYDTLGEIMSERRGDSSNMPGYKNAYTTSPQDVEPSDKFAWKVVAVVSFNNAVDWAAYRGPTDWSDDEVAMSGSKLKEGTARGLFPLLSNIPYRL